MKKSFLFAVMAMMSFSFSACSNGAPDQQVPTNFQFDFEKDNSKFEAIFADYHDDGNHFDSYDMASDHKEIPVDGIDSKGLYIASSNRSDDIFMGYIRKLEGFRGSTEYTFKITFQLATNVESGTFGIGGSPADAVAIKAGILSVAPEIKEDELGVFRFHNIDIGNQLSDGMDAKNIGNMGKPEGSKEGFVLKEFSGEFTAKSDENGAVWLIIGSESGFEGFTEFYLDDIIVEIK